MGNESLEGLKIIEMTEAWAGPVCASLMGDMGADVIRLSRINDKDSHNKFDIHNRSKRSIVADLKNPESVREILKLI